jgi:acetate kinase
VLKLSQELRFGFTNLCQEQKTTLNTGVTETELRYKIQRKYLTMLGIYTAKYGQHKLSHKFHEQLQVSMIKFTKMITF